LAGKEKDAGRVLATYDDTPVSTDEIDSSAEGSLRKRTVDVSECFQRAVRGCGWGGG